MKTKATEISNEEFILKYRDWRSKWRRNASVEEEVSYVSRLAEFMGDVPLRKATKAVLQDFHLHEMMRLSKEERAKVPSYIRIYIPIDVFLADLSKGRV